MTSYCPRGISNSLPKNEYLKPVLGAGENIYRIFLRPTAYLKSELTLEFTYSMVVRDFVEHDQPNH
jgi:hypothetical protein